MPMAQGFPPLFPTESASPTELAYRASGEPREFADIVELFQPVDRFDQTIARSRR